MTTKFRVIGAVVGLAALVALISVIWASFGDRLLSAASVNYHDRGIRWVQEGLYAGDEQQFAVDVDGDLTTSASATFNGNVTYSATTTQGSLACTVVSGSFADATTTLFSMTNPFGATSTVRFANADITGVSTSTLNFEMGTTTSANVAPTSNAQISGSLIDGSVATSTLAYFSSGVGTAGMAAGGTTAGGTSQRSIQVGPTERIALYATSTNGNADNGGILGGNNTFAGTFNFEVCR